MGEGGSPWLMRVQMPTPYRRADKLDLCMAEDKSGKGEGQGLHMLHAQATEKMGQANAVTEHGHTPTSEKIWQTKAATPNTVHCHQDMG